MRATASTSIFISAVIALGLACSGCSFIYSRGPSAKTGPAQADITQKCSTSAAPPALDAVFTGTHLGSAAWGLSQSDDAFGGSKTLREVAVGADFALAALHLGSAIYGYVASSDCREARRIEAALEARRKAEAARQAPASTAPRGTAEVHRHAPPNTAPQGPAEIHGEAPPSTAPQGPAEVRREAPMSTDL